MVSLIRKRTRGAGKAVYLMVAKKKELQELGKMNIQGYTQAYLLLPKWPQLDLPAHLCNDVISITSYEKINIFFRSEPL